MVTPLKSYLSQWHLHLVEKNRNSKVSAKIDRYFLDILDDLCAPTFSSLWSLYVHSSIGFYKKVIIGPCTRCREVISLYSLFVINVVTMCGRY